MTSILSSISGYFSKSLILGTVLPVVIFMVLGMLFLIPLAPSDMTFLSRLEGIDRQWKVIAASFVAIVLSGLIYNLNIPVLRWYEGYPWRESLIGNWLTRRHQRRFDEAQNRVLAIRAARRFMEQTAESPAANEQLIRKVFEMLKALDAPLLDSGLLEPEWESVWKTSPLKSKVKQLRERWELLRNSLNGQLGAHLRELNASYPEQRGLILPTKLGNVIRSFEYYSKREYGLDSIVFWPRLVAIIPSGYAVAVDDTKTTFDFMLNSSLLSLLLSVSILAAGLLNPTVITSNRQLANWLVEIVIFAALSYFFYRLSIIRVGAWGAMVKSAFDLYRWDLLKQLGYKQEPRNRKEERELWGEISRQIIYGDRYDKVMKDYGKSSSASFPTVSSSPQKVKLEITKGLKSNLTTGVVTFYLRIKNPDSHLAEANIVLTDLLSGDYDYEWESAKIAGVEAPVSGTNPYYFKLGSLLPTGEVVLEYNAVPRKHGP